MGKKVIAKVKSPSKKPRSINSSLRSNTTPKSLATVIYDTKTGKSIIKLPKKSIKEKISLNRTKFKKII